MSEYKKIRKQTTVKESKEEEEEKKYIETKFIYIHPLAIVATVGLFLFIHKNVYYLLSKEEKNLYEN